MLDLLVVLGQRKVFVFGTALLLGIIAYAGSFLLAPAYKTTVTIAASKETPGGLLRSMSDSDALRDRVIAKLELAKRYSTSDGSATWAVFARNVASQVSRDGVLSITAKDSDPSFAARLADTVGLETIAMAHESRLSFTSQQLNRLQALVAQFDQRAGAAEQMLAGLGLKDWRQQLGSDEASVLSQAADLQAEINQSSASDASTLMLQERLGMLQRSVSARAGESARKLPPTALDAIRDYYYFSAVRKRLNLQMEIIRVQMNNELKLAAPAPTPLLRDSPKRTLMAASAAAAGLLLAMLIVLTQHAMGNSDGRLAALRAAWLGGPRDLQETN